jgi:hypothetical protein
MYTNRIIELTAISSEGLKTPVGIMVDRIITVTSGDEGCVIELTNTRASVEESLKVVMMKINFTSDLSIYLSNDGIDVNAAIHES